MTETIAYINNTLKDLYPPGEIRSFTRLILDYVCGLQPHQLLMCKSNDLSDTEKKEIKRMVERLQQSEPVQYILGETIFCGLRFLVNPSVLIPRQETEELVDRIIKASTGKNIRVLDVGTGSGCIAVALSKYLPNAEVTAVDVSGEALQTAEDNNRVNRTAVSFIQTDILAAEQAKEDIRGTFDLIVSNPPYVMEREKSRMEKNVLLYEPEQALYVPDNDPLLFYRTIARLGHDKLNKDGSLYFEINAQCGNETVCLLQREGYANVELIQDISGKDRIIKAWK
ncbi:MAG: peptide chain release factor N(5)-glutamine methyltransferase [Tannerellaceae bacterium]|jgi:release factor glutamine methyltransferase|nr:peptide chain release factor N(5)-glutamine methyltransferase [Tannerellaceae bacterium]